MEHPDGIKLHLGQLLTIGSENPPLVADADVQITRRPHVRPLLARRIRHIFTQFVEAHRLNLLAFGINNAIFPVQTANCQSLLRKHPIRDLHARREIRKVIVGTRQFRREFFAVERTHFSRNHCIEIRVLTLIQLRKI